MSAYGGRVVPFSVNRFPSRREWQKTSYCYCRQYVVQPHIAPYRTAVGDFVGQNLSEFKFDPSERQKINKVIVYFFHYLYFTTSVDNLSMILRKNICNLLWRFCRQNNWQTAIYVVSYISYKLFCGAHKGALHRQVAQISILNRLPSRWEYTK